MMYPLQVHRPTWSTATGIDGKCLSSRREVRSPYRIGDPIWVKPPDSQCTSKFKKGQVTNVISEQSISVNGTLRHVKDHHPALETTPSASDSEQESSESELLIELATPATGGSLENPPTDHFESSLEEEVQPIPLQRSTQSKRPCLHCYLCDHETKRGYGSERESNADSSRKRARLWRVEQRNKKTYLKFDVGENREECRMLVSGICRD